MSKRGQASIFIILGIIVLVLFGALLYFKGGLFESSLEDETLERYGSVDIEPVKDVVSKCVEISLLDAVEWVSNRGGYFNPFDSDEYSKPVGDMLVAYAWHYEHGTKLPSLVGLGNQLNLYMVENRGVIENCIDEKIGGYEQSWNIRNIKNFELDPDEIIITENYVKQRVYYRDDELLSVTKGDYAATAKEVVAELKVPLGKAQKMAADIAGCFNGDFDGMSETFNTFCNRGGVPFRAELYDMRYRYDIGMLHRACTPECDDCFILKMPGPEGDIIFNVDLRKC